MPDVFTKEKRSQVMSRIRGRGNKETEIALANLLRADRITGWRRHTKLPGRPDFSFRKQRVVIFVDGCFWHRCPRHSNLPANNADFWLKKLTGNQERDRVVSKELRSRGWRVVRLWEHEFRQPRRVVARIRSALLQAANQPRHRRGTSMPGK
jgi:DNA mismatch endonuclease (patch repair protein)